MATDKVILQGFQKECFNLLAPKDRRWMNPFLRVSEVMFYRLVQTGVSTGCFEKAFCVTVGMKNIG